MSQTTTAASAQAAARGGEGGAPREHPVQAIGGPHRAQGLRLSTYLPVVAKRGRCTTRSSQPQSPHGGRRAAGREHGRADVSRCFATARPTTPPTDGSALRDARPDRGVLRLRVAGRPAAESRPSGSGSRWSRRPPAHVIVSTCRNTRPIRRPLAKLLRVLRFYVFLTAAIVWLVPRDRVLPAGALARRALGAAGAATALAAALSPVLSATQAISPRCWSAHLHERGPAAGRDDRRSARRPACAAARVAVDGGGLALFCSAPTSSTRCASPPAPTRWDLAVLWGRAGSRARLRDLAPATAAGSNWAARRRAGDPDGGHPPRAGRARDLLVQPVARPRSVALATFTLVLAAARTLMSFRQVQRLFEARRQAVTDELTAWQPALLFGTASSAWRRTLGARGSR